MDELIDLFLPYRPPQRAQDETPAPARTEEKKRTAPVDALTPAPSVRISFAQPEGAPLPRPQRPPAAASDGAAAIAFSLVLLTGAVVGGTATALMWTTDSEPHWVGPTFASSGPSDAGFARAALPSRSSASELGLRDSLAAAPHIYGITGAGGSASAPAPAREAALAAVQLPPPASGRYAAATGRLGFHELVMLERAKMRKVWDRALEKSPVVREYVKEWRATPELAALTARWHQDYDPIAFLKGLAVQPKFFQLLGKYGRSPDMIAVIKDDVAGASPQALSEANRVVSSEPVVRQILEGASRASGLPLGLLAGASAPTEADVLKAVMQNPQLRASAMQQLPQFQQ